MTDQELKDAMNRGYQLIVDRHDAVMKEYAEDFIKANQVLNDAKVPTTDRVVLLPDGTTVKVTL